MQQSIMDSVMKGDVSVNEAMIEKWWERYLLVNNSKITSLFYGFSIASNQCSKCDETSLSLSSINSIYLTLPLRMRGITVNLIVQYLDTEMERMTLQTFVVHLKIQKESTFQDVKNSLDELLQDYGLCAMIVFGIFNPSTHSLMVAADVPNYA